MDLHSDYISEIPRIVLMQIFRFEGDKIFKDRKQSKEFQSIRQMKTVFL